MKKRALLLMAATSFLFAGCAAPPVPRPAPTAVAASPPSLRRQTVAVLPFANDSVGDRERLDFLREWLPDTIAATLQASEELRVVERRQLLRILEEQKLGSSALSSKESRLELAKIAGAQTMIFGDFAAIDDALQVSARVVDVESGLILKSTAARGGVSSARALGNQLAQQLARDLGITVTREAQAAGLAGDRALEEAELYYQGLEHEKKGRGDLAVESYRRALEIDPNDREALRRLKKLLGASH